MKNFEDNEFSRIVQTVFPAIADRIRSAWGKPDFIALMEELEIDRRAKPREGFPFEVFVALEGLAKLHDQEYPELAPKRPML